MDVIENEKLSKLTFRHKLK